MASIRFSPLVAVGGVLFQVVLQVSGRISQASLSWGRNGVRISFGVEASCSSSRQGFKGGILGTFLWFIDILWVGWKLYYTFSPASQKYPFR